MTRSRRSMPISDAVRVDTQNANVFVEGVDCRLIRGSFKVHLVRNDERIASRFYLQATDAPEDRCANFDFTIPIERLASARLRIEVERADLGPELSFDEAGQPTLTVHLMLEKL